jgi:hypothetical protein
MATNGSGPLFIDLARGHQWDYWAGKLGCSEEKLMDAVSYVGLSIPDIQRFLANHRSGTASTRAATPD